MTSRLRAGLLLFFFASGAAGLFYEIAWMRQLILVFGSTTHAVSAVLSAYMLGLALGSFAFGRLADRALSNLVRAYGVLEIGVGLYAILAPSLLRGVAPLFVRIWGGDPSPGPLSTASRFLGALTILLPPTILMGGTLPVLARLFSTPGSPHAGTVGRLYAVNTFGAVLGTFLTGFILLPTLGSRRANLVAAGVNVTLGLLALLLSRSRALEGSGSEPPAPAMVASIEGARTGAQGRVARGGLEDPVGEEPSRGEPSRGEPSRGGRGSGPPAAAAPAPPHSLILAVFVLSGFAAMLYEVGWTRVLALTIGSSVYGFTLMLIAFLAGLALGAAAFARYAARPATDAARALGLVLAGVGLASWGTSLLFRELPYLFARLFTWTVGANLLLHAAELGLCLLVMLPSTLLMGGVFPLVLRLHAGRTRSVGRRVGEAYAANTIGTVIGSMAAGFLILPGLGVRATLLLAVSIDLLLAAAVLVVTLQGPLRRVLAAAGAPLLCGGLVLATPAWDPLMMNSGVYVQTEDLPKGFTRKAFLDFAVGKDQILYYREGMNASVLVGRDGSAGSLYLKVNGKADASTGIDMKTQILLGEIPLLFHPHPESVLVIGLASGISVGSVARHPVSKIRVLEVEAAMVEACRVFDAYNGRVLDDPRVSVVINDARNDVLLRPESYDVIVSEPSNPWMTVASNLFTQEFFEAARKRLNQGGIFCQWFQVYSLAPEDLRSLLATFHATFPHVLAFSVGDASDLVVLGSQAPLPIDHSALQTRMSDLLVALDLAKVGIRRPEDLLAYLYLASPGLDDYVRGAPLNTDDNALIEFSAPLSLHSETIWANQRTMLRYRSPFAGLLTGLPEGGEARREILLNLAEALLREERPRAALDVLAGAEAIASDERSRSLKSAIRARLPSS